VEHVRDGPPWVVWCQLTRTLVEGMSPMSLTRVRRTGAAKAIDVDPEGRMPGAGTQRTKTGVIVHSRGAFGTMIGVRSGRLLTRQHRPAQGIRQ
jgi:hypothetical protein